MCPWDKWKLRFSPWFLVTVVPLVPVLPQAGGYRRLPGPEPTGLANLMLMPPGVIAT